MTKLQNALKVLTNALKTDADYRHGWVANIAMAYQDVAAKYDGSRTDHEVSNEAAENFLNILCTDVADGNQEDGMIDGIIESHFAFAEYLKNYTWHDNTSKGDIYIYNKKKYTEKEIWERWRDSV